MNFAAYFFLYPSKNSEIVLLLPKASLEECSVVMQKVLYRILSKMAFAFSTDI